MGTRDIGDAFLCEGHDRGRHCEEKWEDVWDPRASIAGCSRRLVTARTDSPPRLEPETI